MNINDEPTSQPELTSQENLQTVERRWAKNGIFLHKIIPPNEYALIHQFIELTGLPHEALKIQQLLIHKLDQVGFAIFIHVPIAEEAELASLQTMIQYMLVTPPEQWSQWGWITYR